MARIMMFRKTIMGFQLNLGTIHNYMHLYSKMDKAIMLVELKNSILINVDELGIIVWNFTA